MKILGPPHVKDEDGHGDGEEAVGQRFYAGFGIHAARNLRFIRRRAEPSAG
jgi:hypothetical protein